MDELLQQFVVEALELTQLAAEDLLALERDLADRERLKSAFRAFHTLKGSVGLFDLAPMHRALHAAEDLLSAPSKGTGELDAAQIGPLLAVIEWTERCVRQLSAGGSLGTAEAITADRLISDLAAGATEAAGQIDRQHAIIPAWAAALFAADPSPDAIALRYEPLPDSFFSGDDPIALMASVPGIVSANIVSRDRWGDSASFDPFRSNLIFEALSIATRTDIEAAFRLVPDQLAIIARPRQLEDVAPVTGSQGTRTVRVDVGRIDRLVDGIGELFAAKNAMSELVAQARRLPGGAALARSIADSQQDFERLAGQMQRAATTVRMVPLAETYRRLPRVVREVATQVGKMADLVVDGSEIEADKSIVDGLYDPLLHIIRNAVDHGIEPPQAREKAGKPPHGRIAITTRQRGHRIEVDIADDGTGIDVERIRELAVSRGLLSSDEAGQLDDDHIHEILFRSGFSTSADVTEISGRGVGMDVVRVWVEQLGGRVSLSSDPGRGTTVSLSLPTTFAMTKVMVVDAAGDRYGVPMDAISETTKVPASAIAPIRAGEAFVLRDKTVPVVRLTRLLGLPEQRRADELVMIADLADGAVGFVIDAIGERFETMLRPPAGLMRAVPGISGTTVLGNGSVIMVLDLEALIA